ncbi:xylulokinase [Spiribacter onubensis]|uniref:Xylulose kinase n=1 Tax=Spiribacter onubensis TaxID=3122420 RepID=A0ABV3S7H2_9GAMM
MNDTQPIFLGLDLGSSAVKAVAARNHSVIAQASAELSIQSCRPGWSEQCPDDWINAAAVACRAVVDELGSEVSLVAGVGLSGQMHGATVLDAHGQPLRPCILWNDSRSAPECRVLEERLPGLAMRAGVPPMPGFTAPKLLWIARHEPELYARIRHILLPKDYLGLWLHGELVTDRSDAAGTLWLDEARGDWDRELCEISATDPAWLPSIHPGTARVGGLRSEAAKACGLPAGLSVFAGGGDAATGAVSIGATRPGRGFVSLGTSGQLFLCTDGYRPNPARMVHAFAHTLPDTHYQMACMLNGARPLAWYAEILGCPVAELVASAAEADRARAPIFLPYLTGERSPHADPYIRGAFFGLEDATRRAETAYAVMEAIAFTFADAAESFGESLDAAPHLLAVGGGTRSEALLQLIADCTGRRIGRSDGAEAGPALGAALLAAVGAGAMDQTELARSPDVTLWLEPGEEDALIADRLTRYRALYDALAPLSQPDR